MDSNCIGIVKLEIIRIECYFQKILTDVSYIWDIFELNLNIKGEYT